MIDHSGVLVSAFEKMQSLLLSRRPFWLCLHMAGFWHTAKDKFLDQHEPSKVEVFFLVP